MRILITGSSGFLGGRISKFLKENKYKIISLNRKKNFPINKKSKKKIEKICKKVDVVINCIGKDIHTSKNRKKTIISNSEIPDLIYSAGNNAGVKYFIFISTYHIYDLSQKKINENSKLLKKNLYTETKILGEKKIKSQKGKTKIIILRLCNLFGYPITQNKNCSNLLINYIIKKVAENKTISIKSRYNEYRYYSSMKMFNVFLIKILKNLNKINFKNRMKIYNYSVGQCFNILELLDILQKKIFPNKIIKLKFKYKNLIKKEKFLLTSLHKNFLPIKDKFFTHEILQTYNYYKNLKK